MAVTALPVWPLFLFGILEPLALVWAYITGMSDPFEYYEAQAPHSPARHFELQALAMTLQFINVCLLLAAVSIVCCWTTHAPVSRYYLLAVAFADFGHIHASYKAMGEDNFWDFQRWNAMIWGNVGASVFLNINRWLTLFGAFGKLQSNEATIKKRQ